MSETTGLLVLGGLLAAVVWAVWRRTKAKPDLRLVVCRGHAGDGIERCEGCGATFCRECDPEGHCVPAWRGPWA